MRKPENLRGMGKESEYDQLHYMKFSVNKNIITKQKVKYVTYAN